MLGFSEKTPLLYLALARIYVGYSFLTAGWSKWKSDFIGHGTLGTVLHDWMAGGKLPAWYREFLVNQVTPHVTLFAWLTVLGEIGVGVSLMLGLGVRVGAFVGLILNLNFYFASGQSLNALMAILQFGFLMSGAGRTVGLDGAIRNARGGRWVLG